MTKNNLISVLVDVNMVWGKLLNTDVLILCRQAVTEISVLHDLLTIVKQKPPQYMVLDPVQADPPEPKAYIQFLALKKVSALSIYF